MKNLLFWDGASALTYPDGTTATPDEVRAQYPCHDDNDCLLIGYLDAEQKIVGEIENLCTLRQVFGVADTGTKEEQYANIIKAHEAQQYAQQEAAVRRERDEKLLEADTVYCNAANWSLMTAEQQELWQVYKQALRDIPQQEGFPTVVEWPQRPV